MYHCGRCREEAKKGFRENWNFTHEEAPDKQCPNHHRVMHDIYIDRKGEEHTLDRWDATVFRAILTDLVYEIEQIKLSSIPIELVDEEE